MGHHLEQETAEASRRSEFFLWGFAIFALFLFLGHNALWASEDRWAEIAREMLISGDWLHPAINWHVYFDKPPLSYWVILPFAFLRGGVDELVARIPSALAGLATLWGVLILGKKMFDRRTALLAGWLLLSCYGFLFWSRTAAADMANVAAIILAVAYFYRVEDRAKFHHYLIFYLICFLGALTKGLPALVMPFVIIAPHLLMNKRWKKHLKIWNIVAFIFAAAIYFLPFYLAAIIPLEAPFRAQETGLSGLELVWKENVVRVFNAFDHKDPFYSYLYNLPRTLLPWVLVIGVAIAGMVKNWKKIPMEVRELAIGTLLMFILFSCSTSRRWYYILPMMPFCTLLAAAAICQNFGEAKWNRPVWLLMRLLVIIAASLGVATLAVLPLWDHYADFSLPLLMVISLPVAGALALAVILLDNQPESPVEHWMGLPRQLGATVLGCAILVVCVFCCVLPSTTKFRTEKKLYMELLEADLGITPERMFSWNNDAPPKMLFYLDMRQPMMESVISSWADAYTQEQIDAMSPERKQEEHYLDKLAALREFLTRNAGQRVLILSYDRKSDINPLARVVTALNLSLDVNAPDFTERTYDVRPNKSRRRSVWILDLPQNFGAQEIK